MNSGLYPVFYSRKQCSPPACPPEGNIFTSFCPNFIPLFVETGEKTGIDKKILISACKRTMLRVLPLNWRNLYAA